MYHLNYYNFGKICGNEKLLSNARYLSLDFQVLFDEPMTPYVPGINDDNEENEIMPPPPINPASRG